MAIVDALNKVTGGHGSTIEEAVKNLSSGGSGSVMVIHTTQTGPDNEGHIMLTMDKTWQEIHDAFVSGTTSIMHAEVMRVTPGSNETFTDMIDSALVTMIDYSEDPSMGTDYPAYTVRMGGDDFVCYSPSEYPTREYDSYN